MSAKVWSFRRAEISTEWRRSYEEEQDPLAFVGGKKSFGVIVARMINAKPSLTKIWLMAAFVLSLFIAPVAAMENQALSRERIVPVTNPRFPYQTPAFAISSFTGMLIFCAACLLGTLKGWLGPLMGITSVLWFIMRNDPAVRPRLAWM